MVRVFVDSSNPDDVMRFARAGITTGATTNSSIIRRDGGRCVSDVAHRLLQVGIAEVHVQVLSEDENEAMEQAIAFSSIDPRVKVKIPVLKSTAEPRLKAIKCVVDRGIEVNVTGCTTVGQALAASLLRPAYVSLLWGRLRDQGGDPSKAVELFTRTPEGERPQLIVGSIRTVEDAVDAWDAGADIITVAPRLLNEWLYSEGSVEIASAFREDARSLIT